MQIKKGAIWWNSEMVPHGASGPAIYPRPCNGCPSGPPGTSSGTRQALWDDFSLKSPTSAKETFARTARTHGRPEPHRYEEAVGPPRSSLLHHCARGRRRGFGNTPRARWLACPAGFGVAAISRGTLRPKRLRSCELRRYRRGGEASGHWRADQALGNLRRAERLLHG